MVMRQTVYTQAVAFAVKSLGHANNQAILEYLEADGISASPTTIHRVSKRLCDAGIIACAPNAKDGSMRYDGITSQHDHFVCRGCDGVADVKLSSMVRYEINKQLEGCSVDGQLVLYGLCKECKATEGVNL